MKNGGSNSDVPASHQRLLAAAFVIAPPPPPPFPSPLPIYVPPSRLTASLRVFLSPRGSLEKERTRGPSEPGRFFFSVNKKRSSFFPGCSRWRPRRRRRFAQRNAPKLEIAVALQQLAV